MSQERVLNSDTLITSKTNLRGEIIYANDDFLKYSDYSIKEVLYKPHSLMR
ncbi:histidine kinase, partial [Campylobacter insulaenigrae]|nr:histidine kinase [Campylobacter insulaenigrae]MCR6593538.1 histidine kinase [Campylobacter insulaenigrae]